jgi:hypothetical protein
MMIHIPIPPPIIAPKNVRMTGGSTFAHVVTGADLLRSSSCIIIIISSSSRSTRSRLVIGSDDCSVHEVYRCPL